MIQWNLDKNILTLTLDMTDFPMNVWNDKSVTVFSENIDKALADQNIRGIIITSGKKDFLVGADLKSLMPLDNVTRNMDLVKRLNLVFRKLETGKKPVVAAINGSALGGGYELCLACHRRIAANNNKIRIGLPESTLGLLPGAGGTQRLPRLIGIANSLNLLVEGRTLRVDEALKMGLIDEITATPAEMIDKAKTWILANPEVIQPWDNPKYKIPGGGVQTPAVATNFSVGTALLRKKTASNYPSMLFIMSCVFEGLQLTFDRGLEVEARYFKSCLKSPVAKNIIQTMFLDLNDIKRGVDRPKDIPACTFQKIGILGSGMMGSGIAYSAAGAGLQVILKDVSLEAAEKGKDYSAKLLKPQVEKGRLSPEDSKLFLERIKPSTSDSDLKGCDLVIEAVTENRKIKEQVIKSIEAAAGPEALIASNTSTLPISGLAEYSSHPENFIGLHFFSPVDKMPLVEIIIGKKTSQAAIAKAFDFVRKIDKVPIIVNDGRGFFTSRVFASYVYEGMKCLSEGISPALIENAGKMAGMPVGPLAVADEVSLDLLLNIIKQTEEDLGKKDDSPAAKVTRLFVEKMGRLGRKSNKGFYDYPAGGRKVLWPELAQHFPLLPNQPKVEAVKARLLDAQRNESRRALDERVLRSTRDGNIASILGLGFPTYTGGVFG
jgi:3-hydroxyacyl-CoA dehydrogenase/enoyl-CoA hydratase/3-hydroxybutyryl-CoA epimerase